MTLRRSPGAYRVQAQDITRQIGHLTNTAREYLRMAEQALSDAEKMR